MVRRLQENLDFVAIALLLLTLTFVLLVPFSWPLLLRIVLGLLFVLIVPGYALSAVFFPGRSDLDEVERLALSLGLSVVAIGLLGLALDATPWGLKLFPMILGLFSFTGVALLIAFYRRRRRPPAARFFFPKSAADLWVTMRPFLLIGTLFVTVAVTAQVLRPTESNTEFYLLGPEGSLENFPTSLAPGQAFTLTFGVHNREGRQEGYRIQLPFAGKDRVIEVPRLDEGATWERTLTLRAPIGMGSRQLNFNLYRTNDSRPYRSLRLFITLTATFSWPRVA